MNKKIATVLLLAATTSLSACSPSPSLSQPQGWTDKTAEVVYDAVRMNQKYIGSIVPDQESMLSFTMPGRVTHILVREGDFVKKGQLLAAIDGYDLEVAASSSFSMVQALRDLQGATSDMFDAQISAMTYKLQQLESTQKSMLLTGTNVGNTQLGTAELGYLTNIAEFENTLSVLDQQEFMLYTNAQNAFSQTKVFLEPLGVFLDELFGISSNKRDKDDGYDIYLGAKDAATLNKTEQKWMELQGAYSDLGPQLSDLSQKIMNNPLTEEEKKEIYTLLTGTQSFLLETRELLKLAYKSVDQSLEDMRYFPASKINELKQYITIYQANLEKVLLSIEGNYTVGIKGSIDNINAFGKQSAMQRTLLGQKVSIAKNQFSLTKEQLTTQNDIIAQQYNEAKAGLEALKKQKESQVAQLESQIVQVSGQGNQTHAQIRKTEIRAPYDGLITQKNTEEGELINPGMPVVTIGSMGERKVRIHVSDKDIASMQTGSTVSIYIPVLEETLSGEVTIISPMANMFTRRRDVEIMFTSKQEDLPLGSQATVLFEQQTIEGRKVPQQAIQTLFGATTVTKMADNGLLQQTPIQVLGCAQAACIVSGAALHAGDFVRLH